MAIPVLLWGAAAVLGATGLVKGAGAISDINEAKEKGERAERRYKRSKRDLEDERNETNESFKALGEQKVAVFSNQIQHILNVLSSAGGKTAKSSLKDFQSEFSVEELKEMKKMVETSLELGTNLGSSAVAGALAGLGAYGSVPLIATASTGTAISTLSGAAATNATLAWLGGGSLAAGGFGMAGGMIALGGIVAGPALAVGGFMLASKAEEALTQAAEYSAKVDEAIEEMELVEQSLQGLRQNAHEISDALNQMVERFEAVRTDSADDENFHTMLLIGKGLKELMDIQIMNEDGSPIPNIKHRCDGYLEMSVEAV